jgi:hypothetical protein
LLPSRRREAYDQEHVSDRLRVGKVPLDAACVRSEGADEMGTAPMLKIVELIAWLGVATIILNVAVILAWH